MPRFSRPALRLALGGAALAPLPALAHTGHLAEAAAHNHWLAGAAIGAAAAIALWNIVKDRKSEGSDSEAEAAETADEPEAQEA